MARKKKLQPRIEYSFAGVRIGQSLFFPSEPAGTRSPPAIDAWWYGKREGKRFLAQRDGNGVRITRVA